VSLLFRRKIKHAKISPKKVKANQIEFWIKNGRDALTFIDSKGKETEVFPVDSVVFDEQMKTKSIEAGNKAVLLHFTKSHSFTYYENIMGYYEVVLTDV